MPDEKIDKSKNLVEKFSTELGALQSYDSFRNFILKYFVTPDEIETFLSIVGLAELGEHDLTSWTPFLKLFRLVAYREFGKKLSGFKDEGIRLGILA
jgi:hypothetical protein